MEGFDWYKYAVGGAASRPDSFSKLNPEYASKVSQLIMAADSELGPGALRITSAYRSPELQAQLFQGAVQKYGSEASARKWVAPPGKSKHNAGLAIDFANSSGQMLRDPNSREAQWIKANAPRFGLDVPMSWEPWQVELPRNGAQPQQSVSQSGGPTTTLSTSGAMPMGLLNMPQEPQSFGDRIKAGFQSGEMFDKLAMAFNSLRLNPDEGLGQMIQAKQSRKAEDQKTNRTAAWLEASGRPDLAQAVAAGALGGREAVGLFYQPKEDTRLQELQIQKAEFELGQLQAGIGQDPDVQASQALPDQSGVVMTMRDGSVRVKTVGGDTLEGQAALDFVRKSQETNAEYQRSIYGAREEGKLGAQISQGEDAAAAGARGSEIGKAQGAAIAGAPGEVAGADMTLEYIGELRNHPGIDIGTGATSLGNSIPGTPGYDFQNRLNQLLSGGFLTAIDQLRGMGALSNAEGQTATRAISRMDAATSKEEFLAALADYERIVKAGRERAAARMNGRTEPQGDQGAAPTAGTVRKKFNPQTGAFE